MIPSIKLITKALIRLCGCAGWSAPLLFTNHRRQVFSRHGPFDTFQKANNKGADQTVDAQAQAGLRLCCSQTTEDRFSHVAAHFILENYTGFAQA